MGQQPVTVLHNVTETATTTDQNKDRQDAPNWSTNSMTASDESHPEVRSVRRDILGPKINTKIGAWNVRTMYEQSKMAQVLREMENYQLDILGVSECRWTGSGKFTATKGETIMYSGRSDNVHQGGVAILISKAKKKSLLEWEPISDRIIRARFDSRFCKLSIIQCYAPTNDAEDHKKDEFYEQLLAAVSKIPQHDVLLVMGDLNAKVGANNTDFESTMGKFGHGIRNNNGDRLVDFCANNSLVIGGTLFPHKDIHKLTWTSPNRRDINQIDHVMINGKWRKSLNDVRAYRGADANSDHYLVIAKIRLKLRTAKRPSDRKPRFDVAKLKQPAIRKKFTLELRNRFSILEEEEATMEEKWDNITQVYTETSMEVLGLRTHTRNEILSQATWNLIDERKALKKEQLNCKSLRLKERSLQQYKLKDKEVKRSARKDKRNYLDEKSQEAEEASIRGDQGTVYKVTRELCNAKPNCNAPVKDQSGNVITNKEELAQRWVQHFQEVLNRPEPDDPASPEPAERTLDVETGPPTQQEISHAIKSLKNNKAPGIDSIQAELLKVDTGTATNVLSGLFNSIWEAEKIPPDWNKGLIVKLPKKGDLANCNNWRGITLLSIPSKVFCKVLLNRIASALDQKLRPEQAGFRKGKGCIDQIFALRNIMEQCLEWNAPLYLNFIDFQKAFDSIHRESLWKILRSYGVPDKVVKLISLFYENFECSIILEDQLTEWFQVKSGVRQGCILSPILFLVVIDWVMRKTTSAHSTGIRWTLTSFLEDLDFADDLVLLAQRYADMQTKSTKLWDNGRSVGLTFNIPKTKTMYINVVPPMPITIDGQQLEEAEEFTYLGSMVSKDNGTHKDISQRLRKARTAFLKLSPIWKSSVYSIKTKIKLYNSSVKSVLLYGAECWRDTDADTKKMSSFHNRCLRRICKIFWPNTISNENLYRRTKSEPIENEIRRRRMRWLGHILRMESGSIAKVAHRWTPQGKRKRGRPKLTWRRTMTQELAVVGISWDEAGRVAKDRERWRRIVAALCPTRDEED